MSRDQRVDDNWALLYALEQATKGPTPAPVAVAFNLVGCRDGQGSITSIVLILHLLPLPI